MSTPKRLPAHRRVENPPRMNLTERDVRIFRTIHAFDGCMSEPQIRALEFTGERQCKDRLSKLYQNAYVERCDPQLKNLAHAMLYRLDKKAVEVLADLEGTPTNEFRYRKEFPKLITHSLRVNDVRVMCTRAMRQEQNWELAAWVSERQFNTQSDRVNYRTPEGIKATRVMKPDGYFILVSDVQDIVFRAFLEVDLSNEDNGRILEEKIYPYIAYIESSTYQERFGAQTARVLIVTTGPKRVENMKRKAERAVGKKAGYFWFTSFQELAASTFFAAPIWCIGGRENPTSIHQELCD